MSPFFETTWEIRKYVYSCDLYDIFLNCQHGSWERGVGVEVFGKIIEKYERKCKLFSAPSTVVRQCSVRLFHFSNFLQLILSEDLF